MRVLPTSHKRADFRVQKYLMPVAVMPRILSLHRVAFCHAIKRLRDNTSMAICYDARKAPFGIWIIARKLKATGKHIRD
jgi:hypothetical protein